MAIPTRHTSTGLTLSPMVAAADGWTLARASVMPSAVCTFRVAMMDDATRTILDVYSRASATQVADGRDRYPRAGTMVRSIATWSDTDPDRVAAALAALSPRNPWLWNVQDAAAYAYASTHGLPRPSATTFGDNQSRAWSFLTGDTDWTSSALKVRAFVRAIMGDTDSVVVDVWAVRVATGGARDAVANDTDYVTLADAHRDAAAIVGETPRELQAITWLVGQSSGLGSHRSGRHDRTLKRGTLPFIAELLTGQLGLPW